MSVIGREAVPKILKVNFKRRTFPWSWVSIPSLLLVWMIVATQFPSYILPQVWEVADEAYVWLSNGELFKHLWASFAEEAGGFGAAILVAILCGFLAGFYRGFREYIVPLNGLFMAIPPRML